MTSDKPISTKELDLYKKKDSSDLGDGLIMPLSKHLDELRNKIIVSLIFVLITASVGFYFSRDFIGLLLEVVPSGTAFLQIKPGEFFFTSLRVALYFGIASALPVVIWQLGTFFIPGLSSNEKKVVIPILIGAPFLFCAGSVCAYFFVIPSMINFLLGYAQDVISASISIESFVSFALMIMAICGCAFLLPIIIFALANVGIINSKILISKWRYALLLSVVLGAVFTPTPDPFNMSIVSGILILLYFISLAILKIVNK